MAFPYIFEANFESGSNAEWDSETDVVGVLDFPHFKELARSPWSQCAPNRGAYCMRVRAGGATDNYLVEDDCDVGVNVTSYFRFYLYFGGDFTASANDTFSLFKLRQAGGTVEATFGGRIVAATNVINLGIGETAVTSWATIDIQRNKWYCIELRVYCDPAGAGAGVVLLYIDNPASSGVYDASVASLTQGAIGNAMFGIMDMALTTSGTILFDNFVQDDGPVGVLDTANPYTMTLTKSGHVFVGPGNLCEVDLLSGAGTDCVVAVYDTNTADTTNGTMVLRLNNTTSNEFVPSGPLEDRRFHKGCYVSLTGTNPRALVNIYRAPCLDKTIQREFAKG